jgi:hypothetical protein
MQTRRLPLPDDVLENVETPQVSDNTSPARTLQDTGPAQPAQAQSTTNDQQAPNIPSTPSLTDYNIIITSAGNIYVKTESGWQKLEYNPQSDSYSLASVDFNDIFSEVNRLGGTGYRLDPQLAEKIAREEPHVLMWYGVEDALRYAKLKETFPELQKEKWITEADVQNVITQRLESYSWKPDTREKYETLKSLSESVFRNPEVWTEVEKDINRQLAEAKPKIEELQRFYEAKALKQLDAEHDAALRQQIQQQYKFFEYADPLTLATSGVGRGFISGITLGLIPHEWLPKDTGHFYEALYERYRELSLKLLDQLFEERGLKPLLDMARIMLPETGSPLALLLNNPDIWAPVAKEYLVGEEKIELEVLQKQLTPEKRLAYGLGYALGDVLGLGALNLAASKTIEPVAQKALGKLAQHAAEHPESTLTKIAEKLHLIQREQLVPKEVEAALIREAEGTERGILAKTRVTEWAEAEEVLGKTVPESMKLQPGEVSMLPIDVGGKTVNVPIVGEGEFGVVGGEKFAYMNKGLKLKEPFFFYGKGTGEESFLFARLSKETGELVAPRYDFLRLEGKVAYQKVFEQAMGGMPKATLYTEEMGVVLGFSRTPRIPVKETFTPARIPSLPPIVLPPKLPMKEEEREGKGPEIHIPPPKIPVDIHVSPPDIGIKSLSIPSSFTRPFQAPKPEVAEFVSPKVGEFSVQAPRVEPKVAEVTAPKLGLPQLQLPIQVPKVTPKFDVPPQNIPDHPPPDNRIQPKLPPLPSLGGTRDLPSPRSLKMYSWKIWQETWFGDIGFGSGRRRGRGRGGRKRGGRKK